MSKNHPPQPTPLPPSLPTPHHTTPFHSMRHHYKKDISPVSSLISIKVKSRTPFAAILSNISKNKPQKNQTLYSSLFTNQPKYSAPHTIDYTLLESRIFYPQIQQKPEQFVWLITKQTELNESQRFFGHDHSNTHATKTKVNYSTKF